MKASSFKGMIQDVARDSEILDLTRLRKRLNKAKDSSLPTLDRINHLIDVLALATSYQERLTQMKISLRRIEAQVIKSISDKRAEIMEDMDFLSLRKKTDQTFLLEKRCRALLSVKEYLSSKQDAVQYALDYVNSASFNIKSILSLLKEHFSAEGVR